MTIKLPSFGQDVSIVLRYSCYTLNIELLAAAGAGAGLLADANATITRRDALQGFAFGIVLLGVGILFKLHFGTMNEMVY